MKWIYSQEINPSTWEKLSDIIIWLQFTVKSKLFEILTFYLFMQMFFSRDSDLTSTNVSLSVCQSVINM